MTTLIGCGSDVSARVRHDLPAMRHPLGRIVYYCGPQRFINDLFLRLRRQSRSLPSEKASKRSTVRVSRSSSFTVRRVEHEIARTSHLRQRINLDTEQLVSLLYTVQIRSNWRQLASLLVPRNRFSEAMLRGHQFDTASGRKRRIPSRSHL
jgi:hypothetical protein